MNHDDPPSPQNPLTPPSTPFLSTAPSDPQTIPAIQLPKESPQITGMAAALYDHMKDLEMPAPAAVYPTNAWIIADDNDVLERKEPTEPATAEPATESITPPPIQTTLDSPLSPESPASTTSGTSDSTEFSWSDAQTDALSDEEKEDRFVLPPRPWDGVPHIIMVLLFAYLFTQSFGLWTGRLFH